MNEAYYEREQTRLENKRAASILGLEVAVDFIKFSQKNVERQKKKIADLIYKMQKETTYKGKQAKRSTLVKEISKEKTSQPFNSHSDIRRAVFAKADRFRFNCEYREKETLLEDIVKKIYDDPVKAATNFASDYTNSVYQLEQLAERKKEEAKQEAARKEEERRKKLEEQQRKQQQEETRRQRAEELSSIRSETYPRDTYKTPTYDDYPRDTYTPTYSRPEYERPTQPPRISQESIQRDIDKKVAAGDEFLDYELKRQIQKHFEEEDGLTYYGQFYDTSNIEDIYEFYVLSTKDDSRFSVTMKYVKIVEMGVLAAEIGYKDLMNGRNYETTKMAGFVRQFDPHGTLNRYAEARDKYLKFYNKLNDREKAQIDKSAERYDDYREKFSIFGKTGKDIATVEQIKRVINQRIRNDYLNENILMVNYDGHGRFKEGFQQHFKYSLQYMTEEEIASLYYAVRNKERDYRYIPSNTTPEERERLNASYAERISAIQELCAETIRDRIKKNDKSIDWNNEQEKTAYLTQREKDLVAICRDYFHEQPFFTLYYIKESQVKEGYGTERVESTKAIQEAKRRYYGMNKLQQVISKLDFNKLTELSQKETLTSDELSRVNTMFRR